MEEEQEPSSARLILTLGIAGFISGLILVSVYLYTKPIIEKNKAEALKAAIFEVLPNTSTYQALGLMEDGLQVLGEAEDAPEWVIYEGFNGEGERTGFALPGAEPGYQDIISALIGYDGSDERIIGFKVLESKETPGLGDKIYKDEAFQLNFKALGTDPNVAVVKKGEKSKDNEVEAITGATISSNAIGRLINGSLEQWKSPIRAYLIRVRDSSGTPQEPAATRSTADSPTTSTEGGGGHAQSNNHAL